MLKMNQKYIRLEKQFTDIRFSFYVCDYKDIFENHTEDWNCDNDIYTMEGQYMEVAGEGYRDFISKEEFNYNFFEYSPNKIQYILNTETMIAYDKIQEIKYENINYMYLENYFIKDIMTKEKFKSICKEVK